MINEQDCLLPKALKSELKKQKRPRDIISYPTHLECHLLFEWPLTFTF